VPRHRQRSPRTDGIAAVSRPVGLTPPLGIEGFIHRLGLGYDK
jgi:hypothetical protein